MHLASEVFGSSQEAARWFRAPALEFGYRRPVDLIWTPDGLREVFELLQRLEYDLYT